MAVVAFCSLCSGRVRAQRLLTLEECRSLATTSSGDMKSANERIAAAEDLRKMALAGFFPKVAANGVLMWNEKNVEVLSNDEKERINHMGDAVQDEFVNSVVQAANEYGINNASAEERFRNYVTENGRVGPELNQIGQEITSGLEVDMSKVAGGAVTVTQPIYLGGKLIAAYHAAKLSKELAELQGAGVNEKVITAVDEAYWRVVSLKQKQKLAQEYAELLECFANNVQALSEAEMATPGDVAKVRVKYNEAQMNLTKATGGLALSKMLLCQLCGLPLDSDIDVEELTPETSATVGETTIDTAGALQRRRELKMLEISDQLAKEGVRVAASALQPNIVVAGSYGIGYPNMFNGFEKEWGGMFSVSLVANIPLVDPSAWFAVRAAKRNRKIASYELEEARGKITLQVQKLGYELNVARKKLEEAVSNAAYAEETLRMAEESFKAGVLNSNDLLAAQTSWRSAQSDLIDAMIEIKMDELYLKQATGL